MSQESLSSGNAFDNGFLKSLKVLFTTADSSVGSSQSVQLIQHVEAQDCQLFKYGTSNAVDLTLAFWYKSNVTGTHIVTLDKPDSTRTTCPVEFTVSSSGTWEHKVLNFNANDTIKGSSGAIANDNGTGLRIIWNLLYGSDFASGTNGSWTQGGTGHFTTSNQQNIAASNNNYVEVTGVQLEVGQFTSSTLPPFQHEDFGDNLKRCQRYAYEVVSNESNAGNSPIGTAGIMYSSGQMMFNIPFPVPMRTNPSLTCSSASNNYSFLRNSASDNFDDFVIDKANSNFAECKNSSDISGTAGHGGTVRTAQSNLSILFDAEL